MPNFEQEEQITCYKETGPPVSYCCLTCGLAQRSTSRLEGPVKALDKTFGSITVVFLASSCVMEMHPADSTPPPQASVVATASAGTGYAAPSAPTVVRSGPTVSVRRQDAAFGAPPSVADTSPGASASTATPAAPGGASEAFK